MSGNSNDMQLLLENLRDLNLITDKITNEMNNKNKVLESGMNKCSNCRIYLQQANDSYDR